MLSLYSFSANKGVSIRIDSYSYPHRSTFSLGPVGDRPSSLKRRCLASISSPQVQSCSQCLGGLGRGFLSVKLATSCATSNVWYLVLLPRRPVNSICICSASQQQVMSCQAWAYLQQNSSAQEYSSSNSTYSSRDCFLQFRTHNSQFDSTTPLKHSTGFFKSRLCSRLSLQYNRRTSITQGNSLSVCPSSKHLQQNDRLSSRYPNGVDSKKFSPYKSNYIPYSLYSVRCCWLIDNSLEQLYHSNSKQSYRQNSYSKCKSPTTSTNDCVEVGGLLTSSMSARYIWGRSFGGQQPADGPYMTSRSKQPQRCVIASATEDTGDAWISLVSRDFVSGQQ